MYMVELVILGTSGPFYCRQSNKPTLSITRLLAHPLAANSKQRVAPGRVAAVRPARHCHLRSTLVCVTPLRTVQEWMGGWI